MIEYQIDWQGVRDEATEILGNYIRINTTNPPGDEMRSIETIRRRLQEHGIECQVFESAPNRGNLVARIRGTRAPG